MKVLVLAHTPPPFHGQSYMVRIFLDCFEARPGSDHEGRSGQLPEAAPRSARPPVEFVHIDFRLSSSIEDIGRRRWAKLLAVLWFCVRAILGRFRHGVDTLLYVPAPALRHAIYRDWLVMACCRPFFRRRVFWWHAAGLGAWLSHEAKPLERWMTRRLLGRPDLSLVLGAETERDARELASRHIARVPNAIPDPCPHSAPDFVREKAMRRAVQRECLRGSPPAETQPGSVIEEPVLFRLLYIGLCYREKGLFDAVEAVSRANRRLAARRLRIELNVAGRFYLPDEQQEFARRIEQPDLTWPAVSSPSGGLPLSTQVPAVRYHGFVTGEVKDALFRTCDCLIFPTYYAAESFGLVLLEAMAYGMDIIATRWHNIPELFPSDYPGLVNPRDASALDAAISHFLGDYAGEQLRRHYEQHFALSTFKARVEAALRQLDSH
jgi:glycosyltransferase involved in cell wall biosynthesis